MLKKLIKYDFRSAGRLIGILYLAVLAVAVLVGIVIRFQESRSMVDATTQAVTLAGNGGAAMITIVSIYAILLAILMIVTVIMIILHFYRNLLQQEGYLMHTLPVPAWMHVASKTITGFLWMLIACVVAAISLLIIGGISGILSDAFAGIQEAWADIGMAIATPSFLLFIITCIVGSVVTILTFYLALSIGNLANRHKIFYAILAFIVILIVMTVIRTALMVGMTPGFMNSFFLMGDPMSDTAQVKIFNQMVISQLIQNLAWAVVFFTGTRWILQKKLNLE